MVLMSAQMPIDEDFKFSGWVTMKKVSVVGSGVMAMGVTQACMLAGYDVVLVARSEEKAKILSERVFKSLKIAVKKGRLDESVCGRVTNNFCFSTDFSDLRDSDIILECVAEDMAIKKDVIQQISVFQSESAIIASNTSSLSITELSYTSSKPENFLGLHFFNPANVMRLTEVIKGLITSDECLDKSLEFVGTLGKEPVIVEEAPGFVVNRLLIPMINEAIGICSEGVAKKEDIDRAMKLGANHPIGPLALSDLIGNDVCLSILESLHAETGDPKYRAHPLLRKMVRGNLLGKKTGEGFYKYN